MRSLRTSCKILPTWAAISDGLAYAATEYHLVKVVRYKLARCRPALPGGAFGHDGSLPDDMGIHFRRDRFDN